MIITIIICVTIVLVVLIFAVASILPSVLEERHKHEKELAKMNNETVQKSIELELKQEETKQMELRYKNSNYK